jgi:type II secretory pathway pseudopilin PulG
MRFKFSEKLGFTVVELLVVITIMVLIVSMTIPSFKTWRLQQDLTAAQREMTTQLQKIRSYSLSGRQIQNNTAKNYALRINKAASPDIYTIEGVSYDAGSSIDRKYDGATYPVLETWKLPSGIQVTKIDYERPAGAAQTSPNCVIIGFSLPYGSTYIDTDNADGIDDDGVCDFFNHYNDLSWLHNWSNAKLTITLGRPGTTATKTITVNGVTGQIYAN